MDNTREIQYDLHIIVASWLILYCYTGNFGFTVLIFKIFKLQKLLGAF